MGKSESAIQNEIRLALPRVGATAFRANVGMAYTGDDVIRLANGDVLIKNPRPFNTGLPPGFSDLFGFALVTITEDMVGKNMPVFMAIEVKTSKGRVSEAQRNFIEFMVKNGCLAGVARSVEDAVNIVKNFVI